jgi:hypothetical protein
LDEGLRPYFLHRLPVGRGVSKFDPFDFHESILAQRTAERKLFFVFLHFLRK